MHSSNKLFTSNFIREMDETLNPFSVNAEQAYVESARRL